MPAACGGSHAVRVCIGLLLLATATQYLCNAIWIQQGVNDQQLWNTPDTKSIQSSGGAVFQRSLIRVQQQTTAVTHTYKTLCK